MLAQADAPARGDTPAVATLARTYRIDRQGTAVAEEGSPTPRRALGPLPDQPEDTPDGDGYGHALPPDEPSPLTSTGRLRRLAVSPASPASPAAPARTPVPPPAPVLPESAASLRPASGRRFSATDEPFEHGFAAPRRSAVSPASPPSVAPLLPPPPRPTTPPAVRIPAGATFTPSPYAPSPAAGPLAGAPGPGGLAGKRPDQTVIAGPGRSGEARRQKSCFWPQTTFVHCGSSRRVGQKALCGPKLPRVPVVRQLEERPAHQEISRRKKAVPSENLFQTGWRQMPDMD